MNTEPDKNSASAQSDLIEVLAAIREYHDADVACRECAAMLLSDGIDPEPARLMQQMMKARTKMFRLAGL